MNFGDAMRATQEVGPTEFSVGIKPAVDLVVGSTYWFVREWLYPQRNPWIEGPQGLLATIRVASDDTVSHARGLEAPLTSDPAGAVGPQWPTLGVQMRLQDILGLQHSLEHPRVASSTLGPFMYDGTGDVLRGAWDG